MLSGNVGPRCARKRCLRVCELPAFCQNPPIRNVRYVCAYTLLSDDSRYAFDSSFRHKMHCYLYLHILSLQNSLPDLGGRTESETRSAPASTAKIVRP